jgi:hypothetical protein
MKWTSRIRSLLRFAVASLFWLNALFLFRVSSPQLEPVARFLRLGVPEIIVLFFLAMAAALTTYGLGSVILDLLYIYFFPFVLIYYLVRAAIYSFSLMYRVLWGEPPLEKWPPRISVPTLRVEQPQPPASQGIPQLEKRSVMTRVTRVFRHFTFLWCALILVTTRPPLLWIAVIVVLAQTGRTLLTIFQFVWQSSNWLGSLEGKIKAYAEGLVRQAVEATEITENLRTVWSGLVSLQLAVNLLRNRRRVMQWAVLITLIAVAGVYIYVGILFSFGYYGVARVEGLAIRWRDFAVISLFIPISYTNLPKTVAIGLIGGIHSIWTLVLGAGTIVAYLRRKMDSVYDTTVSLATQLQHKELQEKLVAMNEKFQAKGPPGSVSGSEK